ncbi:MAG: ketoacyl-ACP synthase III [Eubacterium sp.]|nr:ketoacyl-ACP synthase III [Eubacterium sp.]
MRARIAGTGSCLPKLRVTNDDLGKVMDTSDEWIRSRTGIGARHLAVEETTTSMSVSAARKAMEEAGIQPEELELIIGATVSADHVVPPLSCEVQRELGAVNAAAYDLCAACSGFVFALNTAQAYIQCGMYRKILIIGAETLSKLMDWQDRSTCVLFGDGAGAAVVCADADGGVLAGVQGSDGAKGMVLACAGRPVNHPFASHAADLQYVQMNGQEVYKFAVRTVPMCIDQALLKAGIQPEQVKLFLLHQANLRIIEAVAKRLKQPMEKFPVCLEECGNVSAASVPILLDRVNRDGMLKRGDCIVLAGFGAGLTWGAVVLTW